MRKTRFNSLQDCKRFLARITNQLNQDEITESKAKSLGYLVSLLQGLIKDDDLEQRLQALEKQMETKK